MVFVMPTQLPAVAPRATEPNGAPKTVMGVDMVAAVTTPASLIRSTAPA